MFKATKTRMGIRLTAVACAALLSVSLSGCGNGSTSGKSGASNTEKKTVVVPNITKAEFKKLNGTKIGEVTAEVHELSNQEKKSIASRAEDIKKISDKVQPSECASLIQHQISTADLSGVDNLIMAGGMDKQGRPHVVTLSVKPSEAQIKTYKESEPALVNKCPQIKIELPGKTEELNLKSFDVSEYKDITESAFGFKMSTGNKEQATIEVILKNTDHQAVQVIAPTSEIAKKVMNDFIKTLHLRG